MSRQEGGDRTWGEKEKRIEKRKKKKKILSPREATIKALSIKGESIKPNEVATGDEGVKNR